ncbi:hypothetical protein KGF54_005175 [Candida jiufengensis]|uniref:uncharacterized protein n=1 Tax=Candida jiufengensis TaxID=497108 RepID=UPI0022248CE9|nr:uncharacterized protein KGF54_005175 [Candida jiufengensis]KAI5950358.1 hypothetical protein KGF54_005175 [Candida jiufengensis]
MTSPLKSESPMLGEINTGSTPFELQQQPDTSNININNNENNGTNNDDEQLSQLNLEQVQQSEFNSILPQDIIGGNDSGSIQYLDSGTTVPNYENNTFEINSDLMDIDQLPTDLPPTQQDQEDPSTSALKQETTEDQSQPQETEEDPISKIKKIELLPNLYTILFDITKGTKSPKDFNNLSSGIRLKINNLKNHIKEIDEIQIPPNLMLEKINLINENNIKKQKLINDLRLKINEQF